MTRGTTLKVKSDLETTTPNGHEPLGEEWEKSFRSGNNGQCFEARFVDSHVEIRNSNSPDAGVVRFTRKEWEMFGASYEGGQFRLPAAA